MNLHVNIYIFDYIFWNDIKIFILILPNISIFSLKYLALFYIYAPFFSISFFDFIKSYMHCNLFLYKLFYICLLKFNLAKNEFCINKKIHLLKI